MNKQEIGILNDIRLLIEERNALTADKAALIGVLRHSVDNCENCKNGYGKPCDVQEGHDVDCVTCTDACTCRECRDGSNFEWIGRSPKGKRAAPEHPLPVGVQMAMDQEKTRKKGDNDGRK